MATTNNIDLIEEELNEEISNDDLFNITSWGADPSVRELITQYKEGDIEKPELQRKYVWTKKTASRFVESLLLGLPIPSIFLANQSDGRRLIIDGYQRIRTLSDFIEDGVWHGDDTEFRLSNSPIINRRWRNKKFSELNETDKRRLKQYTIHAIIFEQKQPHNDSGMFQVFERINTGSTPLNDQEIRNCVYQGELNTILIDLNKNNREWRVLFGNEKEDSRMRDVELILRFFAIFSTQVYDVDVKQISLKQLLNKCMSDHISPDDFTEHAQNLFSNTVHYIYDNLGSSAFYNLQNNLVKIRKKLNPTVFDSIMVATAIALSRNPNISVSDIKDKKMSLLRDTDYRESITQGTMTVEHIRTRISKALYYLYNMSL